MSGDACCADCANSGGSCQDKPAVPAPRAASRVSFLRQGGGRGGADPLSVLMPAGATVAPTGQRTLSAEEQAASEAEDRKSKGTTTTTQQGNREITTSTIGTGGAATTSGAAPTGGAGANNPPPQQRSFIQSVPWWGWTIGGVVLVGGAGALAYTLASGPSSGPDAEASEDLESRRAEIRARMAKLSGGASSGMASAAERGDGLDRKRAEIRARMARAVNGKR